MQPAFEVAEQHCDGLDALLVGEVFQAFFLNFVDGRTLLPLLLGLQIQFLQLVVR